MLDAPNAGSFQISFRIHFVNGGWKNVYGSLLNNDTRTSSRKTMGLSPTRKRDVETTSKKKMQSLRSSALSSIVFMANRFSYAFFLLQCRCSIFFYFFWCSTSLEPSIKVFIILNPPHCCNSRTTYGLTTIQQCYSLHGRRSVLLHSTLKRKKKQDFYSVFANITCAVCDFSCCYKQTMAHKANTPTLKYTSPFFLRLNSRRCSCKLYPGRRHATVSSKWRYNLWKGLRQAKTGDSDGIREMKNRTKWILCCVFISCEPNWCDTAYSSSNWVNSMAVEIVSYWRSTSSHYLYPFPLKSCIVHRCNFPS